MGDLASHKAALRERHHALDAEITLENQRPHPDDTLIAELKRKKLLIKDELAQ